MTDPEARLYKKSPGSGAMLCFVGHTLIENRSGLIVQAQVTQAHGRAERKAALEMIHRHSPGLTRRLTLGADKGYDSADFVTDLQQACVTPHVARKSRHEKRRSPRGYVIIRDGSRNQAHKVAWGSLRYDVEPQVLTSWVRMPEASSHSRQASA